MLTSKSVSKEKQSDKSNKKVDEEISSESIFNIEMHDERFDLSISRILFKS